MKRRDTVVLDLDGTLIDERGAVGRAFLSAGRLGHQLIGIDAAHLARAARVTAQRLWWKARWIDPMSDAFGISAWDGLSEDFDRAVSALDRLRAWLPAFREAAWRLTLERFGVDGDAGRATAAAMSERYTQHRHQDVTLLPGAADLVEQLAREGRRLVVLTNGPGDGQRRKLAASRLLEYMYDPVISTEVGFAKPDRRAVASAVDRAGGKLETSVMIGDTYDRDIVGALACDVPAIWITDRPIAEIHSHPRVIRVASTQTALSALRTMESPNANVPSR
ncbi:HAD family hydrolase [Streptomyces nigrescens]